MEWFKAFHLDINLKTNFKFLVFLKVIFKEVFIVGRIACPAMKIAYHTITF